VSGTGPSDGRSDGHDVEQPNVVHVDDRDSLGDDLAAGNSCSVPAAASGRAETASEDDSGHLHRRYATLLGAQSEQGVLAPGHDDRYDSAVARSVDLVRQDPRNRLRRDAEGLAEHVDGVAGAVACADLGRLIRGDAVLLLVSGGTPMGSAVLDCRMSNAPAPDPKSEQPEVAALRKKIRGEPLTDEDRRLLARVSRKPASGGVPISQEQMTSLLIERQRRGE
jgi:hypothetical protein